jgi:hypothetical protein
MEIYGLGRIGQKLLIGRPLEEPENADDRRRYEAREEGFEKLIHNVVWGGMENP